MNPSNAISALAGTGSPVRGMLITSIGSPENPAGRLVLALAVGDLQPGEHEQCGMHADDDRHRAGLIALVIFGHDDAAVLAGRHHDGGDVGTLGLDAVAAAVDPAGIRILHDHHASRSR